MLTVRVYDNYILIAFQVLDADDFEDYELSTKFRAETRGDMEKLMACVRHQNHPNYSKIWLFGLYKAL